MALSSPRFRGNPRLELAAADRHRAIGPGEYDRSAVRILQEALIDLSISVSNSTRTTTPLGDSVGDGVYGNGAVGGVKVFQAIAFPGQPDKWDGVVGPDTLRKLNDKFPTMADLIRPHKIHVVVEPFQTFPTQINGIPGIRMGNPFHVTAVFAKNPPTNTFTRLEYRQFVKGIVRENGVLINEDFQVAADATGSRTRPLESNDFFEDIQVVAAGLVGLRYGYRSYTVSPTSKYRNQDPTTGHITDDMLKGNIYMGFDAPGTFIKRGMRGGSVVEFELEFQGKIVECAGPGGAIIQVLLEKSWLIRGSGRVPTWRP